MTTLNSRIRKHVDAIASPITPDDVMLRSTEAARSKPRWPLTAAAGLLLVVGLAATVLLVVDRNANAPSSEPTTTAETTTATTTLTTTPTTTLPPVSTIQFVLDAGLTVEKIGQELEASIDTIDADDFVRAADAAASESDFLPDGIESSEGVLAPGTYDISEDASAAEVAAQMVDRMIEIGAQTDIATRGAALGRSAYEILTIASIIEQEALVPEDRARVSRVIHNRLFVSETNPDDPLPLQVDSAVLYGRNQAGIDTDLPFSEVRTIPTDWNTYLLPGLPLTPIATPSQEAVEAALDPAPNPGPTDPLCVDLPAPDQCLLFFYVLADDDGSVAFAVTAEQHTANVERARDSGVL